MRLHHRHHRRHRLPKRPTGIRLVALLAGVALAYAGILLGVKVIGNRLESADVQETVGSLEGRFSTNQLTMDYAGRTWTYRERDLTNILLIGVDWTDAGQQRASLRYDGQADFLLLLTIDRQNRTISTVQIDRDTMTPIKVYGAFGDYAGERTEQICLSHAYGENAAQNCQNTVWAVSKLLGGIPIDAYIAFNMDSIVAINDALGGITVTLEDDFSRLDPMMTLGSTLTLQGQQAEYYVRGRMGIGDGTNLSRMDRQRTFMEAVGDRVVEGMNQDLDFVGTLFDSLSTYMTTDINRGWLINKAYDSRAYQRLDARIIAGSHRTGEDGFTEFWVDEDALNNLLTSIYFE